MATFFCWLALSLNIYTEAGGEGHKGMQMVADTVITRSLSGDYPKDIAQVILQPKQFAWTKRLKTKDLNGLLQYQRNLVRSRGFNSQEWSALLDAMIIAHNALQPNYKPTYHFIHFYSGKDKPRWARGKHAVKYKGHYFLGKLKK